MNKKILMTLLVIMAATTIGCSSGGEFVSSGSPVLIGGSAQFKFVAENVELNDVSFATEPASATVELVDECTCDRSYWKVTSDVEGPVEVTASFPDGNRVSAVFNFVDPVFELVNAGSPATPLGTHLMEGTRVELLASLNGEPITRLEGTEILRFTSNWELDASACYDPARAFTLSRSSLGTIFDRDEIAEGYIGYAAGERTFRQDVVVYEQNTPLASIEIARDAITGALSLQGITEGGEIVTGLSGQWLGEGDPVSGVSITSQGEEGEVIVRYGDHESRLNTGLTLGVTPFDCGSGGLNIFGECGFDPDLGFCTP